MSSATSSARTSSARRFEAAGAGGRRRRPVRALDACRRGAPRRRGATRSSRSCRPAARRCAALDVTLLGVALERLAGIDADGRRRRRRRLHEVRGRGDRRLSTPGVDGADAAFLLEPTPVASIAAVAADGDVMPQKSTYFYPKALTGLVINPHEW